MAISSVGVGSGLDVENIVKQMVELEKRPIKTLEAKAEVINSKISTYGEIKSLTDDLNAAARDLTLDRTWNAVKINSSNSTAVSATMTGAAQAASYNVEVVRLAQAQTSVSDKFDKTETMGAAGSLSFRLHGQTTPITIDVAPTDTIESVMAKINSHETLSKSVAASVVADSTGKLQLMVRARDSGASGSFTMEVTGATDDAGNKLGKLGFVAGGQVAQDAEIKLNGVNMLSSTNTFSDIIPGLSITVAEAGKTSVLNLTQDKDAIKDSIQKFVDAYNALNDFLGSSTKYDQNSKTAGILQGDSTTVSLQNALRMLTQGVVSKAEGAFTRLSDIGIQMQQGGKLVVDSTKLATGLNNVDALKSLFATKADAQGQNGGIAVSFKAFTDELLAYEGTLNNKTDSLEKQIKLNKAEVEKVEKRAETVEERLRKQYTALDVKMASLSSLDSYISQMVTSWNKSKG
ncbi:flagellar filament capping protein FliD [Comamonas aquatica]|uniref:flagellar filament capping protein FliD n=1 Tax=Comamonas aquatica TaxID=225991 RepID=UPI0022DE8EC3|nr:flagellar filament capping protein FliD [Comamonas aquatica]MDH1903446.1 flagellar filament capping protein FliD [Comamonas aquatica]WBM42416.1 flagellar filament capping protein FliD [Comamonas aquatica]